jgi:hypothetical protein
MAAQRARQGVAAARSPGVTTTPPLFSPHKQNENLTKKRNIEFLRIMRRVALASGEKPNESRRGDPLAIYRAQ